MHKKGEIHCCGEGGEFESFVLNCPLYKKWIEIEEQKIVVEDDWPFCFVGRVNLTKLKLIDKN